MILFINACVRRESRTRRLAQTLLGRLHGEVTKVNLSETVLPALDEKTLAKRMALCEAGDFSDALFDLAKQFAAADTVVIAAPYWDLSFPAVLKRYLEAVSVCGVTFRYTPQGVPEGLCKARKLYYVTTAGGPILDRSFGFGYVKALAGGMFGISECEMFSAENLDIWGADAEAILCKSEQEIREAIG